MMNSVSRSRPAADTASSSVARHLSVCANGLELRIRHPSVRVTEIVGIGEVNELDLGLLLDEVFRRLLDDLLAEVAGARHDVDRSAGAAMCSSFRLPDEGGRFAAARLGGVEHRRHVDVAAFRVPRVPEQTVFLDVEAGQHRGVRRQRRRAPDGTRAERVGGALQDRLMDRRVDARQRIRAQPILADDHDVPDRGASHCGRSRGCGRAAAGRRRAPSRRRAGRWTAPVSRPCDGRRGRPRAARRPAETRLLSSARPTSGIRRSCSFFNLP